jgi:hypothetical protein
MKMSNFTDPKQRETKGPLKPASPPYPRSIILDGVKASDLRTMNVMYCCEQCSYFDSRKKSCAMGFKVEKHLRESQLKTYNLTGKMAFCRSQEVD